MRNLWIAAGALLVAAATAGASAKETAVCYPDGWCEEFGRDAGADRASFYIYRKAAMPKTMTWAALGFTCFNDPGAEKLPWMVDVIFAPTVSETGVINMSIVAAGSMQAFQIFTTRAGNTADAAEGRWLEVEALGNASPGAMVTIIDGDVGFFSFAAASFRAHYERATRFCRTP